MTEPELNWNSTCDSQICWIWLILQQKTRIGKIGAKMVESNRTQLITINDDNDDDDRQRRKRRGSTGTRILVPRTQKSQILLSFFCKKTIEMTIDDNFWILTVHVFENVGLPDFRWGHLYSSIVEKRFFGKGLILINPKQQFWKTKQKPVVWVWIFLEQDQTLLH